MSYFLVIVSLLVLSLYIGIMVSFLRSKEEFSEDSAEEIFSLQRKIAQNADKISVAAGEADILYYEKLCEIIRRRLENNELSLIEISIGKKISTWKSNVKYLDDKMNILPEFKKENILRALHPLLAIWLDYKDRVKLYYKKEDIESSSSHFAMGDRWLYLEKAHEPHQQSSALLIEKPDFISRLRFHKRMEDIKRSDTTVNIRTSEDVFGNIKFLEKDMLREDIRQC